MLTIPTFSAAARHRAFWLALWLCVGCRTTDTVVAGACDLPKCNDGNACTNDNCTSLGVCTHLPRVGACSDGDPCTTGDTCQVGVCAGVTDTCDDQIPCTQDACDKTKGCVHLAGDATLCDDKNKCTVDLCDATVGCQHTGNSLACDDGSACTHDDVCQGGSCLGITDLGQCDDGNPCTADKCSAATGACSHELNTDPCDDGNACSHDDTCGAYGCVGDLDCKCAKDAGQKLPVEDCSTPFDDDCSGVINDPSVCGATVYRYSAAPECGAICYYDELHNQAVNGAGGATNNQGFDTFADGQLQDGLIGVDAWSTDAGNGPAHEWVAWTAATQVVTFRFAKPRYIARITLGLNNSNDGAVIQPPEVQVRLSGDAATWSAAATFKTADKSLPQIASGKRGDISISLAKQVATYVEIRFVTGGSWTFVDEIQFD